MSSLSLEPADAAGLPEQVVVDRPGDRRRAPLRRQHPRPRARPTRRCASPARATSSPGSRSSAAAPAQPLLEDALANLECRVVEEVTGGTHSVFLAEVEHATGRQGAPLAYFRGQFGRLELEQDDDAYRDIRARVMSRELPAGQAAQPRRGRRAGRRPARLGLPRAHQAHWRGPGHPHRSTATS